VREPFLKKCGTWCSAALNTLNRKEIIAGGKMRGCTLSHGQLLRVAIKRVY
jgi:hypothetical protein